VLLPLSGDSYKVAYGYQVIESDVTLNSQGAREGLYFFLLGDNGADPNAVTSVGQAIPNGSTLQNNKRLVFIGTDSAEDGSVDLNYYWPQIEDIGQDSQSTTIHVAQFGIDQNNSSIYSTRVYIDTQTDDLPSMGDTDLTVPTSDVNYGYAGSGVNGQTFNLSNKDTESALAWAYTDWGTRMKMNDKDVEFWMPQNSPDVEFTVTGASSTSTVEGGEELTVAEGDTGTFTTGTDVTVKEINYTATIVGGDGSESDVEGGTTAFTYSTPAPLNGKAQIYTTDQVPAGPKVVVGGPVVNSLAQEVADQLNAEGDMVSGVYGSNIIVAGYSAADTGRAAQDLIDALDSI
jgi:hypothetical protein